jgi:hypothetical protein
MVLTFPFRNWAYNNLLKFFEPDFIYDFVNSGEELQSWAAEKHDVQFYQDRVPDFENELLQVINTTSQETIDNYFQTLAEDIDYIKSLQSKDNLEHEIQEWNEKELISFNEIVAKKAEEYANAPSRKRKHLETYYEEIFTFPILGIYDNKKIEQTNYNFYCIEEKFKFINEEAIEAYLPFLNEQTQLFIDTANRYVIPWQEGNIKTKAGGEITLKPILFCEGDIDVILISKAAELLDKQELLSDIELRYRGSCNNLDKLWSTLTDNNWETIPQKKILLYDCDTNRNDEDFGHIHRRMIPKIEEHIIQRGIENLFPESTINKAISYKKEFVDFKTTKGTERGVPYEKTESIINKHEKRNFCNWLLQNGAKEDFEHFNIIFDIIESVQ